AEYLSLGPVDPNTAMWLRDAAQHHKLPTIRQLYDPRYFPYRYGQAFWAFIAGHFGDEIVGQILRKAGRSGDADGALLAVTGIRADSLALRDSGRLRRADAGVQVGGRIWAAACGRRPPSRPQRGPRTQPRRQSLG